MKATYRTLLEKLSEMTEEQLDCDVSLYTNEEFVELDNHVRFTPNEDDPDAELDPSEGILDAGHPYLVILDEGF